MIQAKEWVSVSDAQPESFKQVLVFGNYYGKTYMAEFVSCGYWQIHGWSTDRDGWHDLEGIEVTHWAYIDLPEHP